MATILDKVTKSADLRNSHHKKKKSNCVSWWWITSSLGNPFTIYIYIYICHYAVYLKPIQCYMLTKHKCQLKKLKIEKKEVS